MPYLSPGGSEGFFAQKTLEITDDILSTYKNQGMYFYHMIA
jgi:pyrophosphate--fructose-6-phosphate 1-phosphotransferase